jgi:pimeloyl-ACP methyl ester carboxylesterase
MVLALVSSCTTILSGTAVAPVIEQRGPTGPVPDGLAKFYGQALSWGDCKSYAKTEQDASAMRGRDLQCTRLLVPLDYGRPDADTITIGVLRHPAARKDQRIGSLVVNPGGPGASGMSTAALLVTKAKGTLVDRFDFVGFDPRGVGASEPTIHCLTDKERDQERAEDDELDSSPAGVAKVEADMKDYAAKCAERTGKGTALLANLGTRDVVKDLDVLRSALGDDKLTYLGYSYGTRIGSTYAETFPKNVRALVLDGALDPNQNAVDELVAQGAGFQKAFDNWVQWCVKRQDCALGQDPATALTAYLGLVRPLAQRPVDVDDGRKLSYSDATTAVVQALYSQDLWEYLNTGLTELKNNRASTLMLLADAYLERGQDGRYSTTQDAFTAIRCVDDPRVTDHNVVLEAQRRYKEVAPFLDDGNPPSAALDACAFWPVPNTGQPHLPSITGLPPVLVVSTTNDPATPYAAGVNLAKALGGGLLTFEGTQHTAFLQGDKCVDDAGTKYLVDLQLPPADTRCT